MHLIQWINQQNCLLEGGYPMFCLATGLTGVLPTSYRNDRGYPFPLPQKGPETRGQGYPLERIRDLRPALPPPPPVNKQLCTRVVITYAYRQFFIKFVRAFSKCVHWIPVITVIAITEFGWVKTMDLVLTIFSQIWSRNSVLEIVESKQWTWNQPFSDRFDLTVVFSGNSWILTF